MADAVMLLHGLGRGPGSMRRLKRAVAAAGHEVSAPGYPSRRYDLPTLEDHLLPEVPTTGRVHIVGHSLGGILAFRLMARLPDERRGWVIQIGAPNLGSPLAKRVRWMRPFLGPALRACERPGVGPQTAWDGKIFAVGGTGGNALLGALKGLAGPHDGIVPLESALASATAARRLIVPGIHMTLMNRPEVLEKVLALVSVGETE